MTEIAQIIAMFCAGAAVALGIVIILGRKR